ncbi:hypothetical protein BC835DRAFT_1394528 [Cytidiella melzeri]|nr:hypothetical protein BC835DRAFT_1394528 [Cytidiella melzeri]
MNFSACNSRAACSVCHTKLCVNSFPGFMSCTCFMYSHTYLSSRDAVNVGPYVALLILITAASNCGPFSMYAVNRVSMTVLKGIVALVSVLL